MYYRDCCTPTVWIELTDPAGKTVLTKRYFPCDCPATRYELSSEGVATEQVFDGTVWESGTVEREAVRVLSANVRDPLPAAPYGPESSVRNEEEDGSWEEDQALGLGRARIRFGRGSSAGADSERSTRRCLTSFGVRRSRWRSGTGWARLRERYAWTMAG
jgi:hypothetical protein